MRRSFYVNFEQVFVEIKQSIIIGYCCYQYYTKIVKPENYIKF